MLGSEIRKQVKDSDLNLGKFSVSVFINSITVNIENKKEKEKLREFLREKYSEFYIFIN